MHKQLELRNAIFKIICEYHNKKTGESNQPITYLTLTYRRRI
jgi:hypothetical protein